jgi:polyferredoxin
MTEQKTSGDKKRIPGWLNKQLFRRLSLLGFLVFIIVTIVQHVIAAETSNVASPEAYCPFGGMETLYRFIATGGSFVPHVHLSNIVIFAAVILTAFVARSGFCGWICPLGFIQELITDLSNFLQKHVSPVRRFIRAVQARGAMLRKADRYIRLLKYGVLIWAVTGAAVFGVMVFRDYDPWATLINITEITFGAGLIIVILMVILSFFIERPWCRYACPLGAVSGLFGRLSPVFIKRQVNLCKNCGVCSKACPMGLPVYSSNTVKSVDCIGCLKCLDSCPQVVALELKVGAPAVGK